MPFLELLQSENLSSAWTAGRSHTPVHALLEPSSFPRIERGTHSDADSMAETRTVCMATRLQIRAVCQTRSWGGAAIQAETAEKETAVSPAPCFPLRRRPSSGSPGFGTNQNQLSVSVDLKRQTDLLVDQKMIWQYFTVTLPYW